jgi:Leucine-rich repeat (LRR) protein
MKISISLSTAGATAEAERALRDPKLRELALDFSGVSDSAIYTGIQFWLAQLPWSDVEALDVSGAGENGDYVALGLATAGLPSTLRSFALRASGLRTRGLVHVAPAFPSALETLDLSGNAIDDATPLKPKSLPKLTRLVLTGNPIADAKPVRDAFGERVVL